MLLDGTNTKRCTLGHSFDRARAGYYNLLLGVSGGTHGDNAEMVEARRDFLSRGFYSPLAERIAELVLLHTPKGACVLDAGCGEGYYTDMVEKSLSSRDQSSNLLAFDISKDAVRSCHKRNARISLAVATAYDMPLADSSVDTVYNVFSPLALDEVKRVLKNGGIFVMVYPGEEHLFSLKKRIYSTPYKNEPASTELSGFEVVTDEVLEYKMELDSTDAVSSLFMMTPYAYRTSRIERERVLAISELAVEAQFKITVYRKISKEI